MNYKFLSPIDSGSGYYPSRDEIFIDLHFIHEMSTTGNLTDSEMESIINKELEHEHIHRVICKVTNIDTSRRFDLMCRSIYGEETIRLIEKGGISFRNPEETKKHYGLT